VASHIEPKISAKSLGPVIDPQFGKALQLMIAPKNSREKRLLGYIQF
jgi:hypothetical protein